MDSDNKDKYISISKELLFKLMQENIINANMSRSDIKRAVISIESFLKNKVEEKEIVIKPEG